jgi:HSP20 family protein
MTGSETGAAVAAAFQESDQTTAEELREWASGFSMERQVRIDQDSDAKQTVLRVHLPDVDPERDVEVAVEGGMLRLRGIRHDPPVHRAEIRHGAFEEWLPLPAGVSAADIRATYADGVLEIGLPAGKLDPPQRVRVTTPPDVPRS